MEFMIKANIQQGKHLTENDRALYFLLHCLSVRHILKNFGLLFKKISDGKVCLLDKLDIAQARVAFTRKMYRIKNENDETNFLFGLKMDLENRVFEQELVCFCAWFSFVIL